MASSQTHRNSLLKNTDNDIIDLTNEDDDIEITGVSSQHSNPPKVQSNVSSQTPIDLDHGAEEDEDEDLKTAIALSLMNQPQTDHDSPESNSDETVTCSPAEQQVIATLMTEPAEIQSDKFINSKATKVELRANEGQNTETPSSQSPSVQEDVKSDTKSFNLSNLGRAQMEAERLARLKRKRDETPDDVKSNILATTNTRATMHQERAISPPVLQRKVNNAANDGMFKSFKDSSYDIMIVDENRTKQETPLGEASTQTPSAPNAPQQYPDGVVLQTYVPGYPEARSISFANVIAPASELQACILSSFIWDFDWLLPHFDCEKTHFCLVMHAKGEDQRKQLQQEFGRVANISLVLPPMQGVASCMHSKLMVLFYEKRVRIVVPTANLVGCDWGVGSVMENTVWLMDLPCNKTANGKPETDFKKSLVAFLRAQNVSRNAMTRLNHYDFSKTQNIGFVYSIAGSHFGNDQPWRDIGHCGLGKTVTSLGLATSEPLEIDFVTSSVGSLTNEFMRNIYLACQGDDGLTEYTLRRAKSFPAEREGSDFLDRKISVQKNTGEQWRNNFRFYFPSQDTVAASNGGPNSAGTVCFSKKWWESDKFPRNNMRDCISIRNGLLMHNKIMFVRLKSPKQVDSLRYVGWTYIGSGNLSESAWGGLLLDRATKSIKLNCRNWECGVVIPIQEQQPSSFTPRQSLSVFTGIIRVPMRPPPEDQYSNGKRKPWFYGG